MKNNLVKIQSKPKHRQTKQERKNSKTFRANRKAPMKKIWHTMGND